MNQDLYLDNIIQQSYDQAKERRVPMKSASNPGVRKGKEVALLCAFTVYEPSRLKTRHCDHLRSATKATPPQKYVFHGAVCRILVDRMSQDMCNSCIP